MVFAEPEGDLRSDAPANRSLVLAAASMRRCAPWVACLDLRCLSRKCLPPFAFGLPPPVALERLAEWLLPPPAELEEPVEQDAEVGVLGDHRELRCHHGGICGGYVLPGWG